MLVVQLAVMDQAKPTSGEAKDTQALLTISGAIINHKYQSHPYLLLMVS